MAAKHTVVSSLKNLIYSTSSSSPTKAGKDCGAVNFPVKKKFASIKCQAEKDDKFYTLQLPVVKNIDRQNDIAIINAMLSRGLNYPEYKELYDLKFADGDTLLDLYIRDAEKEIVDPHYRPFFQAELETPYPIVLQDSQDPISLTEKIQEFYVKKAVPKLLVLFQEDVSQEADFSEALQFDFNCLKALSSGIHFSKMVAEANFKKRPKKYIAMSKGSNEKFKAFIMSEIHDSTMVNYIRGHVHRELEKSKNTAKEIRDLVAGRLLSMYTGDIIRLKVEAQMQYLLKRMP